jgi:uncharacterized FlaG/YvyC family protein
MGQVSVSALRALPSPDTSLSGIAPQQQQQNRARTQAVVSAVQTLNDAGAAGSGREVTYSTDSTTKQLVIQVVDKESRHVLLQWPTDYALELAKEYQKEYAADEPLF